MIDRDLVALLTEHPFFQGLTEGQLETLASFARKITVSAGEFLGREREAADVFYLILAGSIGIETHSAGQGAVRIKTLGVGDIVGWSWLVPPHRWQFDARVLETVDAAAIDAVKLRQHCERDHELGYQLFKRLAVVIDNRLAATRRQLLETHR